jgi:hypothetical protein
MMADICIAAVTEFELLLHGDQVAKELKIRTSLHWLNRHAATVHSAIAQHL